MGVTSRGFTTFDPTVDRSKQMNDYITKDSKENMELIDTQLTTLEETITNKVKLNNESLSNVNFIRNEIVKDGLVENKPISICFKMTVPQKTTLDYYTPVVYGEWNKIGEYAIRISAIYTEATKGIYLGVRNGNVETKEIKFPLEIGITSNYYFEYNPVSGNMKAIKDGVVKIENFKVNNSIISALKTLTIPTISYNKPLTSQEIQHNFNVLSNSPSINHINDYVISTDTDHITDRTGRTSETINRVFYKQNCKEFTSDGSPITVNNGMDGYLLSAKLEGNTVKNYLMERITVNETIPLTLYKTYNIEPLKTYTLLYNVIEKPVDNNIRFDLKYSDDTYTAVGIADVTTTLGLNVAKYTVADKGSVKPVGFQFWNRSTGKFKIEIHGLFEGTHTVDTLKTIGQLNGGLNSTQAVITANNMKYSFYSNLEDKLSGKVIEVGKIGDVADTLEVLEDGSGLFTQNIYEGTIIDSVQNKKLFKNSGWSDESATLDYYFATLNKEATKNNEALCDNLIIDIVNSSSNTQPCLSLERGTTLYVIVKKGTDISTVNDYKVVYQLKAPIVTTIPKELMPTILTQSQNTFKVDSPTKPTNFKLTLPVTELKNDLLRKCFHDTGDLKYTLDWTIGHLTNGDITPQSARIVTKNIFEVEEDLIVNLDTTKVKVWVAYYNLDGSWIRNQEFSNISGAIECGIIKKGSLIRIVVGRQTWVHEVLTTPYSEIFYYFSVRRLATNNGIAVCRPNDNICCVAHRGLETLFPENTMLAFKNAYKAGFRIFETDVKFTKDNVPVLIHDDTLNRTARNDDETELSTTVNIRDIDYKTALTYDFGLFKDSCFKGERICKFEDLLQFAKRRNCIVQIDGFATDKINTLYDLVVKHGMLRHVRWSSFQLAQLQTILSKDKKAWVVFAEATPTEQGLQNAIGLKTDYNRVTYVNYYDFVKDKSVIQKAHTGGLEYEPYSPHRYSIISEWLDLGIDGLTTNSINIQEVISFGC